MADITPMMQQYLKIKAAHKDSILFFRLGDFYEMFDEDARTASRELDLTLTSRDRDKSKSLDEKIPMCGIPYHASDSYIARLIAKGYKVAICEQMEDPATAKGLVERDILRVVTPGTVIDSGMLQDAQSNFISAVWADERDAAVCFCDISTGKTFLTAFSGKDRLQHVLNELGRFRPAEVVLSEGACAEKTLCTGLAEKLSCRVEQGGAARFSLPDAECSIRKQFGDEGFARLPACNPAAARALGGLLCYLYETQKTDLSHINCLEYYEQGRFMELDLSARRNLELTETLRSKEKKGSLLWVLDKTKTAMGARMLRGFLERPLLSVAEIDARSSAVAALVENTLAREELMVSLSGIGDLERLIGRIVYGSAGGRDLAALRAALARLPEIAAQLVPFSTGRLALLAVRLDPLEDILALLQAAIEDEPPFSVREGGFIRGGYHAEVDRLRDILSGGRGVIAGIETEEREKTGIRTLKIGYNKVFGYYIEVSKSFYDQVPERYIRKQTLANCERFITQELKDLEHTILTAQERVVALEFELFSALRETLTAAAPRIQQTAAVLAEADALASLAFVAVRNNYCRPTVDHSGVIEIADGRHPVVEQMRKDSLFVPNDTKMGREEQRVAIITGPNMAGKSTYMRQVALIVLLAQIGSFVPARSAHIGMVDRIFTRIGASDDLSAGQSTFMVEMTEVSDILRQATSESLLILDEIGRGTSTFDGMSIARAVLEYCAQEKRVKTLFATHYHELTELSDSLPGTANFNIAVKTRGEEIIFLRKIVPGGADRSYGIEVAQLAGLPSAVVARAREVLYDLEHDIPTEAPAARPAPRPALSEGEETALARLRALSPDTLTPIEAMTALYEIHRLLRG